MEPHAHPLIFGHRGASASARDNTLEAYALAVAQDADGIELDVRRTADDMLVLHHDAEAKGVGPLVDKTFAEIRVAAPHIPTLDEMLAVTGDLMLDIEIKNSPSDLDYDPHHRTAEQVVAWVLEHGIVPRVFLSSFNWDTMARVRAFAPEVTTGQLLGPLGNEVELAAKVADAGHEWVLPYDGMLGRKPERGITAAHDRDLKIGVWTVDDADRIVRLAEAGIDAIVTNDPAGANAALT